MKQRYTAIIIFFISILFYTEVYGQKPLVTDAQKQRLDNFAVNARDKYTRELQKALSLAQKHGWALRRKTRSGRVVMLQRVNSLGFPVYLATDDNVISAATTQTNTVQPGGSTGLNLSGSSSVLKNKLAIWDGGAVYTQHQEFAGKTIIIKDQVPTLDHATHVAGTMLAKGVYAPAKGMAFNASTLASYDFNDDVAEMSLASSTLLLSNHSYGEESGWNYNDDAGRWEWYGLPGDTVDYTFGFYGERNQEWDKIAFDAPYYLIVESAGNARASTGPAVGEVYYGYKSRDDQTIVNKGPRPANISSNNGYDDISTTANAKNILTVGAVNPLPGGPSNRQSVTTAYFSSWGPTDDGRIKPDIVGNGVDVLSTGNASPTSYLTLSGTSMSAPNITGSLYLLQEYFAKNNNNNFMLSATLKGLVCHTAFDAGNVGPDYIYGWGLLDMKKAAQAITDNGTKSQLTESILYNGQTETYKVIASGKGALAATISWTDREGSITDDGVINNRTPKLVNDLDIRVSDGKTTFMPWVLNPDKPSAPATTGDNIRDNVEQVYIDGAIPGRNYTITVSHKGTLLSGTQPYSLIVTGIGGASYCASAPLSSAGARINNVTLSNINNTPPPGCTTYSDYTKLTVQLEQNKTYPLCLALGTCGANANKIAKVFIDWNGNGIFDADELAATTGVINGTGSYTTSITVPPTVTPGTYSLMRVVLTETSDPAAVKPCGTYGKGETQDYLVLFSQTSNDAGAIAIVSPVATGNCAGILPITVTLKNFGGQPISNIPVTVAITAPDKTVTTFTQTYTGTLAPLAQDNFTLNAVFTAKAGSVYSITAATMLAGDLVTGNDQTTSTFTTNQPPVAADLAANYCDDSKSYLLSGSGDGELFWYKNNSDTLPFTFGAETVTTQPPVNNTYYAGLNDFSGTIGAPAKNDFMTGNYDQFTAAVQINTKVPVIIESARMYIGNSGKITFSVLNANGQVVSASTINAAATRTTPLPGSQPNDPSDKGAVYNLNLSVPTAGSYTIAIGYDNAATIFRNNGGVTGYPFKIGNIFSIIGNTATSASDTAYYKNFYYYLYDIHIKSMGCASAAKQPVTVIKPVITQNGTVLSSNFASGNQWYLDGNAIKGATGQNYSPTLSGNYTVRINFNSGCTAVSGNFVYIYLGAGNKTDIGLTVFPVPANGQLSVLFAAKTSAEFNLSLISGNGQTIYTNKQTINSGNYSTVISTASMPPGTYVLKLILNKKLYTQKVVIVR